MRSSRVVVEMIWDLDDWLEPLTASAKVALVLGSIPGFSDPLESEGRQGKQCLEKYIYLYKI